MNASSCPAGTVDRGLRWSAVRLRVHTYQGAQRLHVGRMGDVLLGPVAAPGLILFRRVLPVGEHEPVGTDRGDDGGYRVETVDVRAFEGRVGSTRQRRREPELVILHDHRTAPSRGDRRVGGRLRLGVERLALLCVGRLPEQERTDRQGRRRRLLRRLVARPCLSG